MPFPFQTLPREIRDEVYKIVLCTIEPAPGRVQEQFSGILTTNTIIKHSIEPQILRVNRQIHDEAICVMTKTNLFVKVTSNIPSMKERFAQKRIPILNITKPGLKLFNGYVMHHTLRHIPENGRSQEPNWVFIMLHRDLDELCGDLIVLKDYIHQQSVELKDPFPHIYRHKSIDGSVPDATRPESFFSTKLQEQLLTPYRSLKGSGMVIKFQGDVPPEMVKSMTKEIETVPEKDCETILSELAQLKLNGNEYLRVNNGQMAGETYAQAIVTMRKLMASPRGKELRQTGGVEFINKLTDLCWVLHSNMAQACMQAIRENTHDRAIVNGMSDMLFRTIDQAMQIEQIFKDMDGTWEPTDAQLSKILYRKTVGCRLVGSRERLEEGARAINMAMQLTPNDVAIEREARNIAELRMSL